MPRSWVAPPAALASMSAFAHGSIAQWEGLPAHPSVGLSYTMLPIESSQSCFNDCFQAGTKRALLSPKLFAACSRCLGPLRDRAARQGCACGPARRFPLETSAAGAATGGCSKRRQAFRQPSTASPPRLSKRFAGRPPPRVPCTGYCLIALMSPGARSPRV